MKTKNETEKANETIKANGIKYTKKRGKKKRSSGRERKSARNPNWTKVNEIIC